MKYYVCLNEEVLYRLLEREGIENIGFLTVSEKINDITNEVINKFTDGMIISEQDKELVKVKMMENFDNFVSNLLDPKTVQTEMEYIVTDYIDQVTNQLNDKQPTE